MPTIRPFHFKLNKLELKDIQMVEALLQFLPATGARENFHLAIRKALHQYLTDVGYYLERIEEVSFRDFFASLPGSCTVAVLGLQPFRQKGFVELDPFLSHLIIEKLLGGGGEDFGDLRPLTETEQGVIEFLLLKLLSQIHKLCEDKAKLHFRLERMILEPSHLRSFGNEEDSLVCLKLHVSCLKRSGFIHIYLPHPWVLEGFLKELPANRKTIEFAQVKDNLKTYEDQPCELWGGLGETFVSYADLKSLEEGDVVLLDKTPLVHKKGSWSGDVWLFVGKGESGGFLASWNGFQKGGEVCLKGILKGGDHG